ncbi:2-phosphosulfolactate phosphatase [candidate division WOR-3 bacterium]|nr:2-phosphosulfolactate phosphatase [candidate division WOR-3 bacterium]
MNEINKINDRNGPCIHLDWGCDGLTHALERKDIVVIVDTLRFSSAVVTAVAHGFVIFPAPDREHGKNLALRINALLASRSDEPGISISPVSFLTAPDSVDKRVVLPSPNGASCAARIRKRDIAYIGCFLNAQAIGEMITALAHARGHDITVIACGEQRSIRMGTRIVYTLEKSHRVFAIEDYLAAGAIITRTTAQRNTEAETCARCFQSSKDSLSRLLYESFSGRYLIEHGLSADIDHAAQLNLFNVVPEVHGGDIVCIE